MEIAMAGMMILASAGFIYGVKKGLEEDESNNF